MRYRDPHIYILVILHESNNPNVHPMNAAVFAQVIIIYKMSLHTIE